MSPLERLGVVMVALVVLAAPAGAQTRDARTPPHTSGPLIGGEPQCESGDLVVPQFGRIAESEVCLWAYDLVPAEIDPDEDFSALWLQYEVKPIGDWCVSEIRAELESPSDGRIVSSASPKKGRSTAEKREVIELLVDGEGSAPLPGYVGQEIAVPAGRFSARTSDESFSFRWKGSSKGRVMLAVGLQTTHHSLPPSLVYRQSLALGAGVAQC